MFSFVNLLMNEEHKKCMLTFVDLMRFRSKELQERLKYDIRSNAKIT